VYLSVLRVYLSVLRVHLSVLRVYLSVLRVYLSVDVIDGPQHQNVLLRAGTRLGFRRRRGRTSVNVTTFRRRRGRTSVNVTTGVSQMAPRMVQGQTGYHRPCSGGTGA
jgi:hypothetical protein